MSYPHFKTTPVKEIVFMISFGEDLDSKAVDSFLENTTYAKNFVKNSMHMETVKEGADSTVQHATHYILQNEADNILFQIKQGSVAIHKLRKYEHFDTLLKKFWDLWTEFVQYTGTLSIKSISVRYLNFIEKTDDETINDLIQISVQQPFGINTINPFIRLQFNYPEESSTVVNLTVTKTIDKSNEKKGVLLDINLNKKIELAKDYDTVFRQFTEMRHLKNEIFFKSITPLTEKKYNHD